MGTTDGRAVTQSGGDSCHIGGQGSPRWFGRSRSLVIAAAITAVALAGALALSQHSLAVTNLLPLLYVLPCAAMMFMCMKGMHHGQQSSTAGTSSQNEASGTTR
jgi:fatty acid desaturase